MGVVCFSRIVFSYSPQVSPYKWLSPHTCRRLFGHPRLKAEKRSITYMMDSVDEMATPPKVNKMASKNKNFSILQPLLQNYHVLRHPAIQKEVEERVAAEARLLSDEPCNPITENSNLSEEFLNDGSSNFAHTCTSNTANAVHTAEEISSIDADSSKLEQNETGSNSYSLPDSDPQCSNDVSDEENKSLSIQLTNASSNSDLNEENPLASSRCITVRKCYITGKTDDKTLPKNDDISTDKEDDRSHMKCYRPQPGLRGSSQLEKQEKERKLATLIHFGHTFPRPGISGVTPHAVAVEEFKRCHLQLLSKSNLDSEDYSSYGSISKRRRKSKFPRICLSGKTASDLLARSPHCTESSDASDDDDCFNNNNTHKELQNLNTDTITPKHSAKSKSKNGDEANEFACHYCDRSFTTKSGRGFHESYAHSSSKKEIEESEEEDEFDCHYCDRTFTTKGGRTFHENYSHSGLEKKTQEVEEENEFSCHYCDRSFTTKGGRTFHESYAHSDLKKESHDVEEENEFACHYCERTFTTKGGLGYHESYAHSSLKKKDQEAEEEAKKKSQNVGEEEDEFACHYCERTFTSKSGVGWHESFAHPRPCRVCAKSFQFSTRWSRHKDPICNPCSEKFPQPNGRPVKITQTTLAQPYKPQQLTEQQKLYYRFKCDICSKLFGKRDRMIKHITNNHPSDMHKVDLSKFVFSPTKTEIIGNSSFNSAHHDDSAKRKLSGVMEQ